MNKLSKHAKKMLAHRQPIRTSGLVPFVLLFAVIATALLVISRAASFAVVIEPEKGTKTGCATTVNDSSASSGSAIQFGCQVAGTEVHVYLGQSIDDAVKTAAAGTTVIVHAGTYPVLSVLSLSPSSTVTIEGAPNETVILAGATISNSSNITLANITSTKTVAIKDSANIKLTDITVVDAQSTAANLCGAAPNSFYICGTSDGVIIENSATKNTKFDTVVRNYRGVHIYGCDCTDTTKWPKNITIRNSEFTNSWDDLIQVTGVLNLTLENNYIHDHRNTPDPSGSTLNFYHQDGIQVIRADGVKILRNTFIARDTASEADQGIIISSYEDPNDVKNVLIANNLIHHWAGSGMTISGGTNIDIVNNTSVDNIQDTSQQFGILFSRGNATSAQQGQLVNVRMWNNIFSKVGFNPGLSYSSLAFASNNMVLITGAGGSNQIPARPDFVTTDINSPDAYKLMSTSAARNAGISNTETPAQDKVGKNRSSPPDVGAYQY